MCLIRVGAKLCRTVDRQEAGLGTPGLHYCSSSMPRLSQPALFSTKSLLPTSTVCSDWPADKVHCDWPNTTCMRLKCKAPFHNRELQLQNESKDTIMFLVLHQFKPERGTESRDRYSDEARMCLQTSHD